MVWYDLKNAFGSVPQELLWEVLERMGAPPGFVQVCKGLYKDAAFTVGNAADGQTDPVTQLVGVFQGCPLSPHLFTAAISPLLHALRQLHDTGVKLSTDDRPGASAYADDLKIFSSFRIEEELVEEVALRLPLLLPKIKLIIAFG
ncbi:hypothetical protein PI125_g21424 [Phytophthora idaei]|nr:hypothetical protein PI125_g21424 [Phytophthora idaei]KAG3132047.1 hypothetical protein PI126_g19807 [Phytophthora idaei]